MIMQKKEKSKKEKFEEICENTQGLIDDSLLLEWDKTQ